MFKSLIRRFKSVDRRPRKVVVETNISVEYHVKVSGKSDAFDLVFDVREDARAYKKIAKKSKNKPNVYIVKREYDGDFIANERSVY